MSVFIFDKDVYAKLIAVEGERWAKYQESLFTQARSATCPLPENSFVGALVRFAEERGACIYGDGGWNRYLVYDDGEVVFSKFHCPSDERIRLAQDIGFRVG